jgi:hypothetical protein
MVTVTVNKQAFSRRTQGDAAVPRLYGRDCRSLIDGIRMARKNTGEALLPHL